ncbi:MAG: pimeloyl-ACP methyl ester carboxylesterase [Parvicella sp.]|jgi:pimeloyl-ACP methyl ester carboxylesterase
MQLQVNGLDTFASTGGKAIFNDEAPVLLFIHGSGQSHMSWVLQGRFFANRGWQVLSPDLPGHGLSKGAPLTTIEAMADWCAAFLDAAGVQKATVIGHSQGGLISLELAKRHPEKVTKLALLACAMSIPVNDALLGMAQTQEPKAIAAMMAWGHDKAARLHDHTMPGQSHSNFGKRVMGNNAEGALFADLTACVNYNGGEIAAKAVGCPTLCVLAGKDRMTPLKFGQKMAETVPHAQLEIIPKAGHMLTGEWPVETNVALRDFFNL